jgi:CheY-like chemotaxis protein
VQTTQEDMRSAKAPLFDGAILKKGLLLIDDDEAFCLLVQATARARGLPFTFCAALEELPSLGALGDYDLVIVDYNLEALTGIEIAEYVDAFFAGALPLMMVSSENLENGSSQRWPASIRKFVNKAFGPFAIVQRALRVLEEAQAEPAGVPLWRAPLAGIGTARC